LKLSLSKEDLVKYICNQLNVFFPDGNNVIEGELLCSLDIALERFCYCAQHIKQKSFKNHKGEVSFNHLHSDQYVMLLYFLSNSIYLNKGNIDIATKVYLLNKSLHGIDVFYEVNLPKIFLLVHPLGTVIGRGEFEDYLVIYQGCTVGGSFNSNNELSYPVLLGKNILYSNSTILGESMLSENSMISTNTVILNRNVEQDKIVFGSSPNLILKNNTKKHLEYFFDFNL